MTSKGQTIDFIALANGSFEEGKRVERERIVAMLRTVADNHEKAAEDHEDAVHGFAAEVLMRVADRIERGET